MKAETSEVQAGKVLYRNGHGEEVTEERHKGFVYDVDNLLRGAVVFCEGMADGHLGGRTDDAGKFRFVAAGLNEALAVLNRLLI